MSFIKRFNPVSMLFSLGIMFLLLASSAFAGEADIILPDLSKVTFNIFGGLEWPVNHVLRYRYLLRWFNLRGDTGQPDEKVARPSVHA